MLDHYYSFYLLLTVAIKCLFYNQHCSNEIQMKVYLSHEELPVDSAYNDSVSELGKTRQFSKPY